MNARLVAALALAVSCGAALALPALWWEPLHLDERITIEFAQRSYTSIVNDVFVDRGGAPLHFFLEHVTLRAPGGIEGLRLPSFLFFLVSLLLAARLAYELAGERVAFATPILLAVAPLGLALATFARMYSLFVAAVLATTLIALRAGRTAARRDWILAGAAAGALVYVHPIAPVYSVLAVTTGLLVSGRSAAALARETLPGAAVALAVAAPYAYALAVLRSRYDVFESERLRTTAGRSVPEEALHALTPGGAAGAVVLLALALVGIASIGRTRPRVAVALGLWLAVPAAFFALVPASTRFFGRYLAPAEPSFYLLVAAGCLAVAGRRRLVAGALVAVVLALGVRERVETLRSLHELGLRDVVTVVEPEAVLFSSTGTPVSDRPPELLDDYLELEGRAIRRVEELPGIDLRFETGLAARGRANVADFVARGERGRGVWVFRGPERRVTRAVRRVGRYPELKAQRASPTLLVVSSRTPATPAALVAQGVLARTAWTLNSPSDRWTKLLLEIGRT